MAFFSFMDAGILYLNLRIDLLDFYDRLSIKVVHGLSILKKEKV